MYEDKTYEAILQEKLARVASSLDKREGSIIFDALAPNSLESAMIYVALDTVLNETFADTASRDYLIMRCAERGITPLPATCAVGIGEFSMDIPVGTRFSCDKYNWAVTEKIESLKYYLTCETAGADPNSYTGQLIPIEYIEGLATAELTSIVINGEDEEATETLRLRYLNSFEENTPAGSPWVYDMDEGTIPGWVAGKIAANKCRVCTAGRRRVQALPCVERSRNGQARYYGKRLPTAFRYPYQYCADDHRPDTEQRRRYRSCPY